MSEQAAEVPLKSDIDVEKLRRLPRLQAILFCDFASMTDDGKVNLLGVFDGLHVHPEKKITPVFVIFVRTAETYEADVQVTLIAPNGQVAATISFTGLENFKYEPEKPNNIQSIGQMRFAVPIEGVYWFDVSYQGKSLGGVGLPIYYRETENKEGGTNTYGTRV